MANVPVIFHKIAHQPLPGGKLGFISGWVLGCLSCSFQLRTFLPSVHLPKNQAGSKYDKFSTRQNPYTRDLPLLSDITRQFSPSKLVHMTYTAIPDGTSFTAHSKYMSACLSNLCTMPTNNVPPIS